MRACEVQQSLKQVLQLRTADLRAERLIIDAQTCIEKLVHLNKKKNSSSKC